MRFSRRAFAATLAGTPLLGQTTGRSPDPKPEPTTGTDKGEFEPQVFDAHQLATMAAIAETIIPRTDTPGAMEAKVHEHLDRILAASPRVKQTAFLEGLSWLDGYSMRTEGKPIVRLSNEERERMLVHFIESTSAKEKPGHDFALSAKRWTATIYYSTQAGEQELNKGGRVPAAYTSDCSA